MGNDMFLGETPLQPDTNPIRGEYVMLDGQQYYKISNYDKMRPFFMSLVSHSDHWLFISSTGGLTAGRKNQHHVLFPYYTDDKLAEGADLTGSKTILTVAQGDKTYLWEPFSQHFGGLYNLSRNLYKNAVGNILLFEEVNHSLQLTVRYSWKFSEKYGFVKHTSVHNHAEGTQAVKVLDGIQNIIPYGIVSGMQTERSNLSHAYKKNELDPASGLGMFMLSAMIVDKAEPSEALRATTVWAAGIEPTTHLLSSRQLAHFRAGQALQTEVDMRAEPGSYLVESMLSLAAGESANWYIVSEIEQDHASVVSILEQLKGDRTALIADLAADIEHGTRALRKLVGTADGIQLTGYPLSAGRHYANVLFNIMRGGIFDDQYHVEKDDLLDYIQTICPRALNKQVTFFEALPTEISYQELIQKAEASGDPDLIRVAYEYLPIFFSRRHGDPSRPWNFFSIETRKPDGSKSRYYQGNWRDIFQNWEALAVSFPGFINSMITKFVNASTIDGYNPYRITRNGIDWEIIEPDDPWSFIGYWGDHQIIYLLKLLEVSTNHQPEALQNLLTTSNFVYAKVPYIIKSYEEICKDPQDTIDFDEALHEKIIARCEQLGADGKLAYGSGEDPIRANLTEKLLLPLLTKLYNFIPEAGIWLNTQRPEWNDANNALVGNGVSMVTLYYIRRYISFCQELFGKPALASHELNEPVVALLKAIASCFNQHQDKLARTFTDTERRQMMDELGMVGEHYRKQAYEGFNGDNTSLSQTELLDFLAMAQRYVDHTIHLNKREDGLYHSYNLITLGDATAEVSYLYEMLEGQVAVLSSGLLSASEALDVLNALKQSAIYREDQYSYMLYPNRQLPRFLEKNQIPSAFISQSALAKALLEAGDRTLLSQDARGDYHFSGDFHNADDLRVALDALKGAGYEQLVSAEYDAYLVVFEEMFHHKAFTGRSGTFFGYEGLGSIYWHMVSKLLLATQEIIYANQGTDAGVLGQLVEHYYEIRAGIGINKSPELYGSFPTDPYSHTPAHKGAQQPGMTGQVKEDILNRWAELGVQVANGCVSFAPTFIHPDEFLHETGTFHFFDTAGEDQSIDLSAGELGFTYCQVPVVYAKGDRNAIELHQTEGTETIEGLQLSAQQSSHLFDRDGQITQIRVTLAAINS